MDREDVVAEVALKELEKKMHLRRVVTEPAYAYYFGGGIISVVCGIFCVCCTTWFLIKDYASAWELVVFAYAMIGFVESTRQRERFNALVELMEIEKDKPESKKVMRSWLTNSTNPPADVEQKEKR